MDYKKAELIFENDDFNTIKHFNSLSFEYSKKALIDALNEKNPIIFLVGEPGSGKSYILNYIYNNLTNIKILKYFTYPFFTEYEFLEILISLVDVNIKKDKLDHEKILDILKKEFGELEYTIFIDEAQHLTLELVEIIRILSDQKIFQFVLSMHKKESEYILSMPHFKTRLPKKIEVSNLTNDEVLRYIQETLVDENLSDIYDELKKSHFNLIIEYSQNNFRTLKQLLSALFSIIYQAQSRGLSKYSKINKHTITMAAIDLGLLNVKS